jgi:hypothetical protein
MSGPLGHLWWVAVGGALSIVVVTVCVVLVTVAALAARTPATRRHCLRLIEQLTQYAGVLRSQQ